MRFLEFCQFPKRERRRRMKSTKLMCIEAVVVLAVLAIPGALVAQQNQVHNHKHHHYQLIDVGTFGGPQSWVFGSFEATATTLNNAGTVVGGADTSDSNPNFPNFSPIMGVGFLFNYADPFINHALKWNKDGLADLGVLPGGYNSFAQWISSNGLIAGASENGAIDPVFGWPEVHAVLWKENGHVMVDLGTLPGGYESSPLGVNNRGQVVGGATDASSNGRAFLWTEGEGLQDLGTLGACCALASYINERGQIAGESALCDTCNQDAFFWEKGNMQRIPDFGGPISGASALNNRGQVVGQSDLPGGAYAHPFLWDKKKGLKDLGLLSGGLSASAHWINDAGEIVGISGIQNDQFFHAVLWKNGKITDLGTLYGDPCGVAESINSKGQIVGGTCDNTAAFLHAFLWENGGPMVDLNALIAPSSNLRLIEANSINDRGEIAGQATTSDGDNHAFLLIPCDEKHGDGKGCEDGRATDATQNAPMSVTQKPTTVTQGSPSPSESMAAIRARLAHRYPYRGFGTHQPK
jgi:probable HAF family extracellular repeat protein